MYVMFFVCVLRVSCVCPALREYYLVWVCYHQQSERLRQYSDSLIVFARLRIKIRNILGSWIRIRLEVKIQELYRLEMEPCTKWVRRLVSWSNTAARLAGWRRVTQQSVILYAMDSPCRLPWRTIPLAPVWGWSITKCTHNTVMSFVTQGSHVLVL